MESAEQIIRMNNLSKELRKYGFAQSSQEAIAQAGNIYGTAPEVTAEVVEAAQMTKSQMSDLIAKTQRLWLFKESADQKVGVIADQLVKVTDKLNEIIKSISLVEMNQAVFDKKLNVLKEKMGSGDSREASSESRESKSSSSVREHEAESSAREKEAARKLDKPIDRNGVAPADVSIEKMFYYGNKR